MNDLKLMEEQVDTLQAAGLPRYKLNALGMLVISTGIAFSLIYPFVQDRLLQLCTSFLSPDGNIRPEGIRKINCSFYYMAVLMVAFGIVLRQAQDLAVRSRMVMAIRRESVCCPAIIRPSPKFVLIFTTLIGLFLIVHIHLYDVNSDTFRTLYLEDGIFESLTPVLMIISAVLLIKAALLLRTMWSLPDRRVWVAPFYALAATAFILYAGEEVSWGQRIIGWPTPETFAGNIQNETNVHNFYNSTFPTVYKAMIIMPFLMLPSILLEFGRRQSRLAKLILPHLSLIGLGVLIGYTSLLWYQQQELLEEMIAVLVLFYGIRAYACVRSLRAMEAAGNREQGIANREQ